MAAERKEKQVVRELWAEEVADMDQVKTPLDVPLYMTLPGAEGRDIQLLIDRGVLDQTEVNGIGEDSSSKVIAVESSPEAVLALQRRWPGLKIIEQPIQGLLRSTSPLRWPEGDHERYCRARVVNLDLSEPLRGHSHGNRAVFPVIQFVRKFGELHAQAEPPINWVLCLTLHADLVFDDGITERVVRLLAENFRVEPTFASDAQAVLGQPLFDQIAEEESGALASPDKAEVQLVLMALVPKLIARAVQNQGWSITTTRNLRYRGGGGAPMVTWLIRFEPNADAEANPDAAYRETLAQTLSVAGEIDSGGEIRGTPATT